MFRTVFALTLIVSLTFAPVVTTATTHYSEAYNTMTTKEKVAYLYGMISQLQLVLELRQASEDAGDTIDRYDPSSRAKVDVDTLRAIDVREERAELRGRIDLNREDEALVWFVYGETNNDLDQRTPKRRVTDSAGDIRTFRARVNDLNDDRRYYYRAAAEDEDGDRTYGSIHSFRTADDAYDDDDDFDSSPRDYELDLTDRFIESGDTITVDWEVPSENAGAQNWIGLYRVNADNTSYEQWTYLGSGTTGSRNFKIRQVGDYEFRLFLDNSYNDEITSRSFEVQ